MVIPNPHDQLKTWRAPGFEALIDAMLTETDRPVYVIGGAVRDFLLGRGDELADLDLGLAPVRDQSVIEVARRVADQIGWAFYPLDAERDVARLVSVTDDTNEDSGEDAGGGLICDVAALRGELTEDLLSRDFPINAMALELTRQQPPRLIDPTGGLDDLRQRRLRVWDEANLDADPVRLLRAVRMIHKFELTPEPGLMDAIRQRAATLAEVSPERIRDELWKILALPRPGEAVADLARLHLLSSSVPELAATQGVTQSPPHHLDVFAHTLLAMDQAARIRSWLADQSTDLDPDLQALLEAFAPMLRTHFAQPLASERSRGDWLVWHALIHDWGKPATRTVESQKESQKEPKEGSLKKTSGEPSAATKIRFFGHEEVSSQLGEERLSQLRFSRREIALAQIVALAHMRPHHLHASFREGAVSRRAAYRFFRDTASGVAGERSGLDVLMLALADVQATGVDRAEEWPAYLETVRQLLTFARDQLIHRAPPLIDGRQLIQHLSLAPGPEIGRLLEAVAEAQASGEIETPEQALALAASLLEPPQ